MLLNSDFNHDLHIAIVMEKGHGFAIHLVQSKSRVMRVYCDRASMSVELCLAEDVIKP